MIFSELNLKPEVLAWVTKLGYTEPTKIQEEVIRESVNGKNIIGQSQTGTGKTAAFVISLLQKIDLTKPGIQALILAPTRELVTQIRDEILALSSSMYVRSLPVYGWSPIGKQIEMLRKWQTIIVGTPGRTIDLIERWALKLNEVEVFILDEVDRMLDMWFVDDIDFIWWSLKSVEQTMAFSATITSELKSMVEKYLGLDYTFIKATDGLMVDKINHSFTEIPHIEKYDALKKTIVTYKSTKTIVFVQTKRDTEMLAKKLYRDWFNADCLNWDMRQRERFKALKDFQDNITDIFVVTDVAARWLNVKNIDLVVNYDVPSDPESYIHRIGRTGRAWAEWTAVMFVANDEKFAFKNIERRNKIKIKQVDEDGNEMERKEERGYSWGRSSSPRFWSRNWGWSRWGYRGRSSGGDRWERSFGGERKSFWDRPERKFVSNDEKRASFDRDGWFDRPKSGYFEKKEQSRWSFWDRKPFGDRVERKSFWDRPERSFSSDRWERKPFGERKSFWDRSEWGERKSFWDRPERKPFGERKAFGNKPERSFDKPKFDWEKRGFVKKDSFEKKDLSNSDKPKRTYVRKPKVD